MNILLFHPEKAARDMLCFCLESEVGATVQPVSSLQEAIECFLGDSEIHLVVTTNHPETDKLFKYILSTNSDVFVVYLSDAAENSSATYPEIRMLAQMRMIDATEKLPSILKDQFRKILELQPNQDFCRIEPSLLVRVTPLKADIFIRLSSVKFVKLYKTGATFTKEDLERVTVKKKVPSLYIRKGDTKEFLFKFKDELETMIAKSGTADNVRSSRTLLNTASEVQEVVLELTNRLGFTPEVREIAQQNVRLTLNAIGSSPQLSFALAASQFKNKNYISSHSIMLAHLTCSIAAQMNWPSDTTFHKLVLASLFHDLSLTDPHHARVRTSQQLEDWSKHDTGEAFLSIKSHANKGAEMVQSLKEIPADVDTILLQHHERPDGSGWPSGLRSPQIAPLSAVFIVAHDIVDFLVAQKNEFKLEDFLRESEQKYQLGTFRKVWKALSNYKDDEADPDPDSGTGSDSGSGFSAA